MLSPHSTLSARVPHTLKYGAVATAALGLLWLGLAPAVQADDEPAPPPATVSAPGSFNSLIGCDDDWQPACPAVALTYDAEAFIYSGQFNLPPGDYEFKIAQDGGWDVNWGVDGVPSGENIHFTATSDPTYIVFDPASHLTVAAPGSALVTLPGSYQAQVGCPADWSPDCLASVMYPRSDGTYTYSTDRLPAGAWEVKVAVGLSWGTNYGVDGALGGTNIEFSTAERKVTDFTYDPATHRLNIVVSEPPIPGTGQQLAQWIDRTTIAVPANLGGSETTWNLVGHSNIRLVSAGTVTTAQAEAHRLVTGYTALHLSTTGGAAPSPAVLAGILQGELRVEARDGDDHLTAQTGIQIAGVLDDLYAAAADAVLGLTWAAGAPTLKLWAPTATTVTLEVWPTTGAPVTQLATRSADGVWTVSGPATWKNAQYLWAVDVFVPSVGQVVTNRVTDPYSVGLTVNSGRSVMVDLNDPAWIPDLWANTAIPVALRTQAAQTIYELHVRDFSMADPSVPAGLRGTYEAFTQTDSLGMTHLAEMAEAGLTTVHLLPTFDIATIPELAVDQATPVLPANAGPASTAQQAAVAAVADADGFNWGYDPYHYMTPEGSYATAANQSGGGRTAAFRSLVGALHSIGLRVVLDEVYNHTSASGQAGQSVLDRIVPGYYHRLSATGQINTSSCCQDTATENRMMGKLMVDSVVLWAKAYHVDGFRFDIMGFHSLQNMVDIRAALDQLTLGADGIDGASIYLYGEAWNFGEVIDDALFETARQANIAGTGIGTFNDRLRDGVRGGGPFDSDQRTVQGFGTGEYTDPNGYNDAATDQLADLIYRTNLTRLGLIGNLADFVLPSPTGDGTAVVAKDMDYGGQAAGYAADPQETINYVDAHDNEALYDNGIWKLPVDSTMDTRIRMNALSLATTALGQSPSFWHAGTEILRSKSLDRNSYNSGDHFNAIDWSLESNVYGTGLPLGGDNSSKWDAMTPLLENPALKPTQADMELSYGMSLDLLRLRQSTPLLTLGSGELVQERVTFPNAGPDPTPGLLVMAIDDPAGATPTGWDIDPTLDGVLVIFNASPDPITEAIEGQDGRGYELSPIQAVGADAVVKTTTWDAATGTVTIPGRTVAVLVEPAGFILDTDKTVVTISEPYPLIPSCSQAADPVEGSVNVLAIDTLGQPMVGAAVRFGLSQGLTALTPLEVVTDGEGRAELQFSAAQAGSYSGDVAINGWQFLAWGGWIVDEAAVVPDLSWSIQTVPVDPVAGRAGYVLTIERYDQCSAGQPAAGVTLTIGGDPELKFSATTLVTGPDGTATVTVTATKPGTYTVTVNGLGLAELVFAAPAIVAAGAEVGTGALAAGLVCLILGVAFILSARTAAPGRRRL